MQKLRSLELSLSWAGKWPSLARYISAKRKYSNLSKLASGSQPEVGKNTGSARSERVATRSPATSRRRIGCPPGNNFWCYRENVL